MENQDREKWRTHMRRSLAQRKRHGANIGDINAMVSYLERQTFGSDKKPPSRASNKNIVNNSGNKIVRPPEEVTPTETGFFKAPVVLRSGR